MKFIVIEDKSPYLKQVISLGEKHKNTLGFLPFGAYAEQARRKKIIAAIENDCVIGYILFNVNQKALLVYIVHLCIDPSYRNKSIAYSLIKKVSRITKTLRGIRVHCRRDYSASTFWPKCGFVAVDEKPGKALKGSTITIWWYDYGQPSILQYANDIRTQSKTKAVIDANIFYDIQKNKNINEEVQGLLADWISVDIELCLTQEIYNEINRNNDINRREINRKFVESFYVVPNLPEKFIEIYDKFRQLFPKCLSESDGSDFRQLSQSIASEIPFFITRDENLLKKSDRIYNVFNTRIIRPAKFIILHDSLKRESEYRPTKLKGSRIEFSRFTHSQYQTVEEYFRDKQYEKKRCFFERLNHFVSSPRHYDIKFIKDRGIPIAFIVVDKKSNGVIRVPFFRVAKSHIGSILARHLSFQLISSKRHSKSALISVTDPFISTEVKWALAKIGFTYSNENWIKANLFDVLSISRLQAKLYDLSTEFKEHSSFFHKLINFLSGSDPKEDLQEFINVEKILFPVKIKEIQAPCYIVPIKPIWAMHLFDYNLAMQDLFGGDPSLLFNVENVYYRSCKPKLPKAPARILWYITKGNGNLSGIMSIKACSYVNEVQIGKPKKLYKKNESLGVYKWPDVYEVAKQNIENDVLSFLFDFTELFEHRIRKTVINDIWQKEKKCSFFPRTPIEIPPQLFYHFYKLGKGF